MATLAPLPIYQFFTDNGVPLAGGQLQARRVRVVFRSVSLVVVVVGFLPESGILVVNLLKE